MNPSKEDIGVLKDYTLDMAFGSDENNFECTVSASNNVCEAGFYLYAEGTEYGGIIDSINVDTESETVIYKGRTWHGILDSKIIEPDAGNDYLVVKGEANTVLSTLISRMGLGNMFKVSSEASGINISHKMNRYISGYIGILRMLKASGAKLNVTFKNGFVELSAEPFVDYSKDEQFDTDQISFTIQKNYKPINHVICLGQGDLKDRRVIHLYADGVGNISGTQTFTGVDEMCVTYDYSNAESDEELIEGGVEIIKASWASDSIEFDFESDDESFDINDVIGAIEFTTGTEVKASITKKIIKIQDYTTSISYSCESGVGTVASSGYPSSGGGSSIVVDAYTKVETDALLNAKQDKSYLSYKGNYTGNIDDLHGRDKCGGYFVQVSNASGTQPFDSSYYFLEISIEGSGALQRATQYNTGESKERFYTNNKWYSWTPAKQDLVSKVKIYETDSEGGNIRIFSPNGYYTEMDMYNDKTFRMYHVDSEGTYSGHVTKSYNSRVNLDVLSGVSTNVQTQLDSKQATLAITNGKGTRNTTYTTNGELTWRRYGQLVIVDIYDLNVPAITVGDESTNILFTGLPKAKHYSTTNLTPFNSAYGGLRVGIKGGDTKIVIWWQTKSGVALGYSGQLIYLAE